MVKSQQVVDGNSQVNLREGDGGDGDADGGMHESMEKDRITVI